jgi:hypothetical protein
MSAIMSGQDLDRQESDEEDRVSQLVTRLQDLLVEEISTVDRAANKRRFLVIKTEGDTMPTGEEVYEQEDGTLTTDVDKGASDAFGTVDAGDVNTDDNEPSGDTIDGADKATPKGVKEAVMSMLEDSAKKIDALVAKLKEMKGMIPPPMLGEGKAIVTALRGVASRYPSPKAKSEDEPAIDDTIGDVSKADAQAAAKALAALKSKIDALVTKVKGLEEGEGSLPGDINKAVDEIAMGVEAALGLVKADAPAPDEQNTSPGYTTRESVVEAAKLLQVAIGKLSAGKPCDEETLRMISKAKDVLMSTAAAKTKTKKTEEPEQTDDDREKTEKAGTKQLSRARREKFKGALDALIKLFEEMIPEAERKSMWPTKKSEEPEPVKKNDEPDPQVVELRKTIDEQNAKIEKLQGAIKDRDDAPTDTNLVPVSKGDDGENVKPLSWEHDLNDPDVDAW